ncbi:MAG TPA: galactokinase [Phycisphaeraceae bacterium]|nr:galactokinase [Phycisphaeraceae bacterium]
MWLLPSHVMQLADLEKLHERAVEAFAARFTGKPSVVAAAPGRVNLIGEHTDYNLGLSLPIAIDRYTLVALQPVDEDCSTLFSLDFDHAVRVDLRSAVTPRTGRDRWSNYMLGVVEQLRSRGMIDRNVNLLVTSDVPRGSGLSSSAALEVATAAAFMDLAQQAMERTDLARLCRAAENEFVGVPCGLMDQLCSAAARKGKASLIDFRTEEVQQVDLPEPGKLTILISNTGVKHSLGTSAYAERKRQCETACHVLGVNSLRDATPSDLLKNKDKFEETIFNRAWHVVGENARVSMAVQALQTGDLASLGRLLFQSHYSLRDQYEVSCPELDSLVDLVKQLADDDEEIYGARMTGAGFGGCTLTVCSAAALPRVTEHLRHGFKQQWGREPGSRVVRSGDGVRLLEQ